MTLPLTGAGPAAGGFSPLSLSPILWLEADAGTSTTTDGVGVSTWTDQSGNGNNATQATGTKQPLYKASIVNGKPTLRFDATDDGMATSLASPAAFTVFLVMNRNGASGNFRAINGSNNWLIGPRDQTAGNWAFFDGAFIASANGVASSTFVYMTVTQNAGAGEFFLNGVSQGTNVPSSTPGTWGLGSNGSVAEPPSGDIAEILIYNSVLSAGNRQSVENYLKSKYGL